MNKIMIILFFAVTLIACTDKTNPYKDLKIPNNNEYNQIILEILKQDTVFINQGFLKTEFIGADLIKPHIQLFRPKRDTSDTARLAPLADFRTSILELNYYGVTDSIHRKTDSIYFSFQNDSAKQTLVDSNIISFFKLATTEIKMQNQQKEHFGYFQFSIPVLNKSRTKAFVQADFKCSGLCGEGLTYVLEKLNNKWTLKLSKIRWVS